MSNILYFEKLYKDKCLSESTYKYLLSGEVKESSSKEFDKFVEKKISIAISTYNRNKLLIRMLNSIINQNYSNYEIIIIDDNSNDETSETIKNYVEIYSGKKIIYKKNKYNLGVTQSKRNGYDLCTGDIIVFADDDDYYIDHDYFKKLNRIYSLYDDCIMTVASTLYHYEKDDSYKYYDVSVGLPASNVDYLNGFVTKFRKPGSMFTLSLNAKKMKQIHYDELNCFNDMSLYLYAALAEGSVYSLKEAVGVYSVQLISMTSGVSAAYTIQNLEAKIDIGKKAVLQKYINEQDYFKWIYAQTLPTLMNFYNGKIKKNCNYYTVNLWALTNLKFPYNIKAICHGFIARIKYHFGRV